MNKNTSLILLILAAGVIFRLILTSNNNFLFNMDSARDMVDVREMVVLGKPRLIGPTSAIEGLFNGPAWYYLLAVPFILSGGDPYASILMEIILWAVGGFFLLKLTSRFNILAMLTAGSLWIASNYIVLASVYAFNPNPVLFLTPLLIFLIEKYINTGKLIYSFLMWFLSGLFFNFEMNFGVFTPIIIFSSVIFTGHIKLLKEKSFWIGFGVFILALLPQVIFDLKHQFIMSRAVLRHLSENSSGNLNILKRLQTVSNSFYNTFEPTLMNHKLFAKTVLLFFIPVIYWLFKSKQKDNAVYVSLIFIFVPFLGYLFLPVAVNPWHLGGEMAASLILIGYLLEKLIEGGIFSKIISGVFSVLIIWFAIFNIVNFFITDLGKPNLDPSLYKNEIAAIDHIYKYAKGENFKVYTFMPSVYDYPYQYLIWWYGFKKYGYLPIDYAYAPNKPAYIPNKPAFSATEDQIVKRKNSGLVFLIKEPNRGYNWKSGWEASYRFMELLSLEKLGSIEVEIRKENKF